jgi:hypothetical protein
MAKERSVTVRRLILRGRLANVAAKQDQREIKRS